MTVALKPVALLRQFLIASNDSFYLNSANASPNAFYYGMVLMLTQHSYNISKHYKYSALNRFVLDYRNSQPYFTASIVKMGSVVIRAPTRGADGSTLLLLPAF